MIRIMSSDKGIANCAGWIWIYSRTLEEVVTTSRETCGLLSAMSSTNTRIKLNWSDGSHLVGFCVWNNCLKWQCFLTCCWAPDADFEEGRKFRSQHTMIGHTSEQSAMKGAVVTQNRGNILSRVFLVYQSIASILRSAMPVYLRTGCN